jgi:hypothetical protein
MTKPTRPIDMKRFLLLLTICLNFTFAEAQSTTPTKLTGSKFAISCANLYFEIDSARGARVSSFKLDNSEILYVDFKTTDNAGSTFWPSPQSGWGWPSPANLNDKPYLSAISGNRIKFKGAIDSKTQLRFYKTMYGSAEDSSITIEYVIKNEKPTAQSWAPWEITRVLAKGITVFSKGSGLVTGNMKNRTTEENGYVWYNQTTTNSPGDKFFCDGTGWISHVTQDNILFVKKFDDIASSKAAPAEAEVEVFTAANDSYSELENQGAYASIAAKDSVTWKVKWYARKLPQNVVSAVGSQSLKNYIAKILASGTTNSFESKSQTSFVKVFPNPASGVLWLESGLKFDSNACLKIYNLQGKLLLNQPLVLGKTRVDISKLGLGYYIYSVQNGAATVSNGHLSVIR